MKPIEAFLRPFTGYVDLRMYEEARLELESLPEELKAHPIVQLARLELWMEMKQWEEGAALGKTLLQLWRDENEIFFKTAYCLHELKRTEEAKAVLLSAPEDLREEALYYYNLACYETQLGNLEEARQLLKTCFQKDAHYRKESLDDPDLEPLRKAIPKL